MTKIDVHQHLWTEPLVEALEERHGLPFVRDEGGLSVLYLAGERPYVIEASARGLAERAALVEADGLDRAVICLSSPVGIEWLPCEESHALLDAHHDGVLSLGEPFDAWGALALSEPDPSDVRRLLDRGCLGVSLPAGALAGAERVARLRPVLSELERSGAPLFVHPGPGGRGESLIRESSLHDPLWWPGLTRYVAQMQAAWLAFATLGRSEHPELRVIFAMLAGLAPLHAERLRARGGPAPLLTDPLTFYDVSSYGPTATGALAAVVGSSQLVYGSDRPVAEPSPPEACWPDWASLGEATFRALGTARAMRPATVRG